MNKEKCNNTYTLKQCENCFKFSYQLCLNDFSPFIKHSCNDNINERKYSIEDVITQIDSSITPQTEEEQVYNTFINKIEDLYNRTIETCNAMLNNLLKISEMISKFKIAFSKYKRDNENIINYLKGVLNIVTFDQEAIEEKISQINDILEYDLNYNEIKAGEKFVSYLETLIKYLNSQFILKDRKIIQFSSIKETEIKDNIIGFNVIKCDIDINNNGYNKKEDIVFTLSQSGFIHGYVFDSNQFNHIVSSSDNNKIAMTSIEKLNEEELISATVDGRLFIWKMTLSGQARYEGIKGKFLNTYSLTCCYNIKVCNGGITKIIIKDDNIIISSTNRNIYLIDKKDINNNKNIETFCILGQHKESVNSLLITSNNNLVSASSKQVIFWSYKDNKYTVEHIISNVHCCHSNSLYEFNSLLFIGGKNTINIININTFQIKHKIITQSINYISSFISYDNNTIIVGGSNGNIFLLEKSPLDSKYTLNGQPYKMKIKQQIIGFYSLSGQDIKIYTHSCYDINSLPYLHIPK